MTDVEGGTPRRLTLNHSGIFASMNVSRDGSRLMASLGETEYEVWKAPLGPDPEANGRQAQRLLDNAGSPMWIHTAGPLLLYSSTLSGTRNLWVMPLDGTGPPRQVTSSEMGTVTHASLSPDGSRVAYSSYHTGNAEIWTMNTDGSDPVQLTHRPAADYWPVWTADGKWLAFGSENPEMPQLWRMPSGGGEPVRMTKDSGIRGDWSPVENRIVYAAGAHLYGGPFATTAPRLEVAGFDGRTIRTIPWPSAGLALPVWSPDGRKFTALHGESQDNHSVWIFDADSGKGQLAVKFPGRFQLIFRACWTPDGKSVIVNRQQAVNHVVMLENFWEGAEP
jgi:Tol biopolymer transport system component